MRVTRSIAAVSLLALATTACGGGGSDGGGTQPTPVFTTLGLAPSPVTIAVGTTQQLTATPFDQNNNPVSGVTVSYLSSAPGVASVSDGGLVTAVTAGPATITATGTKNGVTKTATVGVTVTSGQLPNAANVTAGDNLRFNPGTVTIAVGGTVTWAFEVVDHNVTFDGGPGSPANIGTKHSTTDSRTFPTAGTFPYTCTLHSGMNGTVIVR